MPNSFLPPTSNNHYNREKLGIYGNLGKGANADILFIETVFSVNELDNITMISNIPGSETWDVRDLFQRDVDDDRVQYDIIPYFKDSTKIKYFSPITLILLPAENQRRNILKEIEYIEPKDSSEPNINKIYEKENYYKINIYKDSDFVKLEWNDSNCFMVAIDGQHRLSGLKRWKDEPGSDFRDWKIPVVILNVLKVDKDKEAANLLETVRKTFVYINSKAERINRAREILLNDESVNALCTQEIIQHSHKNDILPIDQRNINTIPLIFFDWQGRVVNKKQFPGPASIKSVEEIYQWCEEYFFAKDGSDFQKSELFLEDLIPPLEGFGANGALSHKDAYRIRQQFNKIAIEGILHLLEEFYPYKKYIKDCRETEKKAIERSDNAIHAFMKLRFGTHSAPDDQREAVNDEFKALKDVFDGHKNQIDFIIRNDIGMRGIVFAFSEAKYRIIDFEGQNIDWLDFSKNFTKVVNKLYSEKWFKSFDDLPKPLRDILTYLIFDEGGSIINYKISQAKDALGSLIMILVMKQFSIDNTYNTDDNRFEVVWDDYAYNLGKTYEKGLRRFFKGQLSDTWKGSMTDFNAEVKRKAENESAKKINMLKKYLNTR